MEKLQKKSWISLREADAIYREEIAKAKLEMQMNQYFAVLTNMRVCRCHGEMEPYL